MIDFLFEGLASLVGGYLMEKGYTKKINMFSFFIMLFFSLPIIWSLASFLIVEFSWKVFFISAVWSFAISIVGSVIFKFCVFMTSRHKMD